MLRSHGGCPIFRSLPGFLFFAMISACLVTSAHPLELMRQQVLIWTRTAAVIVVLLGMPLLAIPDLSGPSSRSETGETKPDPFVARKSEADALADRRPRIAMAEQLRLLQVQLTERGATYLVLETDPMQPGCYRFRCEVPMEGSTVYRRSFETAGADPVKIMEDALRKVDEWRMASRLPKGRIIGIR